MINSSFAPDFIGIGAMKAASEWILSCLDEHPEICVTSYKEINFFNKPYNYEKGLKYYYKFFSHCPKDKIKGEFTPSYMLSPMSADLIYKTFPQVKLIVCLRNPAERAYSDYRYNIQWQ
ncbi:MAG: sulfotransferase domain-containing protein, partial [Candidatus Hermodarchaeota archaeon]